MEDWSLAFAACLVLMGFAILFISIAFDHQINDVEDRVIALEAIYEQYDGGDRS